MKLEFNNSETGAQRMPNALRVLAEGLAEFLQTEAAARDTVSDAVSTLKVTEARAVVDAYQTGLIKGKNAETRKREEVVLIGGAATCQEARGVLREAEVALATASAEVEGLRAYIRLLSAYWCSLGGKL